MRTADGYIVNRCLNGDTAAFGLLVDKYRTGVYALAYSRLRDFQDVAQEVFIKAYRKLRTLKRFDSFHAWLYAITANLCKDWLRARSRRPDREYIEDQDPEILEAPSMDAYREDLVSEMIHEALDSLPETYQQVLTLYYLGGMNSREIAEFLGTSPAAIRKHLSRARSQLKEGMLTMMSTTFEAKKLPASFTFRIVEAIKHVKIQPLPRMSGLPWGLSFAAGIIITVLSLNLHLTIPGDIGVPAGSPLPVEAKVLKTGEIPVDILEISQVSVIASKQGDGEGGTPEQPEKFLMAQVGIIENENTMIVSSGDYNGDGFLELFMTNGFLVEPGPDALYRNSGNDNHWLHINLVGVSSNRNGIGARIHVSAGDLTMLREVNGGTFGMDSLTAEFGLGEHNMAELVEIRWPSGTIDVLRDIPADCIIQITEGTEHLTVAVQPRGKLPITLGEVKRTALRTAMLQNYPNPFNPDTWIPYELAEPSHVKIFIYDIQDRIVRTLNIGHCKVGQYFTRDEATYWDGKNEAGEQGTSGLYFYAIQTGEYTATRKMILAK